MKAIKTVPRDIIEQLHVHSPVAMNGWALAGSQMDKLSHVSNLSLEFYSLHYKSKKSWIHSYPSRVQVGRGCI